MFDSGKWNVLTQDVGQVNRLCKELSVPAVCARLLINRGYSIPADAANFLNKSDAMLYDPFLLADMKKAIERIEHALEKQEKITIYGDYDVDGVTSVSILYMYLSGRGADIDYYIPTRDNEGYGLNTAAFDTIKANGTKLVITVDTGITAIDEIDYANSIGLDIVVTDHHQCRSELPRAIAVVNPKRPDCPYPFKELSGVGVVFKTICALELSDVNGGEYNLYTIKDMCKRYIDLVTIGTIADVMPLTGENRIIVSMGLSILAHTKQIGINALFRAAGIDGTKKITSSVIGFTIAPRINAAGRIGNASRAVQLFLADSTALADVIAEELCNTNRERQSLENEIYTDAVEQLEKNHDLHKESAIVLSSDTWHHGVIGIVASRLTERYNLPSVLISFEKSGGEENVGKGSGRGVKGLNLVKALASCEDLLAKYGGHELAAGLSIERENLDEFRKRLNEYVKENMDTEAADAKTPVDARIYPEDISEESIERISLLEPFGAGNPTPTFVMRDCIITSINLLSFGKHSKFTVVCDGEAFTALFFGTNIQHEGFAVGDEVDIMFSMDINEFRGLKTVQLVVRDMDYADSYKQKVMAIQKECAEIIDGSRSPMDAEIPDRTECSKVYGEIKNLLPTGKGTFSIKKLVSSPGTPSMFKTSVAIKAFEQIKLMSIERITDTEYRGEIIKHEEKVDLFSAPIMNERRADRDV